MWIVADRKRYPMDCSRLRKDDDSWCAGCGEGDEEITRATACVSVGHLWAGGSVRFDLCELCVERLRNVLDHHLSLARVAKAASL